MKSLIHLVTNHHTVACSDCAHTTNTDKYINKISQKLHTKGDSTIPNDHDKVQFYTKVRKQGGSLVTTIPSEIADHDDIEEGDKLAWQAEYSQKMEQEKGRGQYNSNWNHTKQNQEGEK